jgi:hypothetical protein
MVSGDKREKHSGMAVLIATQTVVARGRTAKYGANEGARLFGVSLTFRAKLNLSRHVSSVHT